VSWDKEERRLWFSYLKFWKSITGGVATLFGVAPLSGLAFPRIAPPAPAWIPAVPPLAALLLIVVLFFGRKSLIQARIRKWAVILIVCAIVSLFFYIYLDVTLTVEANGERRITGFALTKEAVDAVARNRVPSAAPRDLLDYFGHLSEDRIWMWRAAAHAVLAFLFCAPSVCSASGLALLMVRNFMESEVTTTSSPSSKKP
jgi:hypothetical protein